MYEDLNIVDDFQQQKVIQNILKPQKTLMDDIIKHI